MRPDSVATVVQFTFGVADFPTIKVADSAPRFTVARHWRPLSTGDGWQPYEIAEQMRGVASFTQPAVVNLASGSRSV